MENRNLENIMSKALKPSFEPDAALNSSILNEIRKREKDKYKGKNIPFKMTKAAALILTFAFIGTAGVYAATKILDKTRVTKNGISTGGDYLRDEDLAAPLEEVTVENITTEEPSSDDKWISRETVIVSGIYENIYYTYPDYQTLVADTGFENNFTKLPGKCESAKYVTTDMGDNTTGYSLDSYFITASGGTLYFHLTYTEGNIAEDFSYGIKLNGTFNVRDYEAPSGLTFTLADDEVTYDEQPEVRTTVLLSYEKYRGVLQFIGMTEDEIQSILNLVIINGEE